MDYTSSRSHSLLLLLEAESLLRVPVKDWRSVERRMGVESMAQYLEKLTGRLEPSRWDGMDVETSEQLLEEVEMVWRVVKETMTENAELATDGQHAQNVDVGSDDSEGGGLDEAEVTAAEQPPHPVMASLPPDVPVASPSPSPIPRIRPSIPALSVNEDPIPTSAFWATPLSLPSDFASASLPLQRTYLESLFQHHLRFLQDQLASSARADTLTSFIKALRALVMRLGEEKWPEDEVEQKKLVREAKGWLVRGKVVERRSLKGSVRDSGDLHSHFTRELARVRKEAAGTLNLPVAGPAAVLSGRAARLYDIRHRQGV